MKQVHKKIDDKCPTCHGDGGYMDYFTSGEESMEMFFMCHECNGTGLLTNKSYENDKENKSSRINDVSNGTTDARGNV